MDDINFNSTSLAWCDIQFGETVHNLSVLPGYTGHIEFQSGTLTVGGFAYLGGGTVDMSKTPGDPNPKLTLNGSTQWMTTNFTDAVTPVGEVDFNGASSQTAGAVTLSCKTNVVIGSGCVMDWSDTGGLNSTDGRGVSNTFTVAAGGELEFNVSMAKFWVGDVKGLVNNGTVTLAAGKSVSLINGTTNKGSLGLLAGSTWTDSGVTLTAATSIIALYAGSTINVGATGWVDIKHGDLDCYGAGQSSDTWTITGSLSLDNSDATLLVADTSTTGGSFSYVPILSISKSFDGGNGTVTMNCFGWTTGGSDYCAIPVIAVTGNVDVSGGTDLVVTWAGTTQTGSFDMLSYNGTLTGTWGSVTLPGTATGAWGAPADYIVTF